MLVACLMCRSVSHGPAIIARKSGPHEIHKFAADNVAVIVQRRGRDGDWPLNLNTLNAAVAALRDGRLVAAYVVQAEGRKVLRSADVDTVVNNLGAAEPRDGPWGLYHWLTVDFMPARFNRRLSDEVPF